MQCALLRYGWQSNQEADLGHNLQESCFQEDLEGQPFDSIGDASNGEEGVDEETLVSKNNFGNGNVPNQARTDSANNIIIIIEH
jgi:hypothetical protein